MGAEERACFILKGLIAGLHGATVDYQCRADVHEFLVQLAGTRFRLQFAERALFRRNAKQLSELADQIIDRIRVQTMPRA
jgi:hypothetical protein